MERIKKALDKARQQRLEEAQAAGLAKPVDEPAATHEPAASHHETAEPHPYNDDRTTGVSPAIEYTHTRRIKPDPRYLRDHRVLTALSHDENEFVNAYKILRTRVLKTMRKHGWNVLAVTSPGHHEGKTLTAINLAISMARGVTGTVLLVDANLERPEVHRFFGFSPELGLNDYLKDGAAIPDILINPGIDRFVIFPGRQRLANHSEMLSSPLMSELVEELKHRYPSRMVIFDLPPVLKADDVLAFAPYVDATLLVVEDGKTAGDDVKRAIGLLEDSTHFLGAILNKVED